MSNSAVAKAEPVSELATMDASQLLRQAIESKADVEVMGKLMDLQERHNANKAREAYQRSISDFQSKCPVIKKDKVVYGKDKAGNYTVPRYSYAPMDAIVLQVRGLLTDCGLSYTVDANFEAGMATATVVITHVLGHSERSSFTAPVDPKAFMNDMQKAASATTYAKRLAFCNALGIMTGDQDDDGQHGGPDLIEELTAANKKVIEHISAVRELWASVDAIKRGLLTGAETGDFSLAAEAYNELTDEEKGWLWLAPTKGGIFTTAERTEIKQGDGFSAARRALAAESLPGEVDLGEVA